MTTDEQALMAELEAIATNEAKTIFDEHKEHSIATVRDIGKHVAETVDNSKSGVHFMYSVAVDDDEDVPSDAKIAGSTMAGDSEHMYQRGGVTYAFSQDTIAGMDEFFADQMAHIMLEQTYNPNAFITQVYSKSYEMTIMTTTDYTTVVHTDRAGVEKAISIQYDDAGRDSLIAMFEERHCDLIRELAGVLIQPKILRKTKPKIWAAIVEEIKDQYKSIDNPDSEDI